MYQLYISVHITAMLIEMIVSNIVKSEAGAINSQGNTTPGLNMTFYDPAQFPILQWVFFYFIYLFLWNKRR